ncbi:MULTISPECIES: fumarylacetoacetate hydrolase family protein [Pseudomonas]|uniref:fumarylacetoacetate hydrolase family protein n=1 Tax=Pseudomonas TaxID=286 RepID=UPI002F26B060
MKLAAFGDYRIGVVVGDQVFDVTAVVPAVLNEMPEQRMNWLIQNWGTARELVSSVQRDALPLDMSSLELLPASPFPSHVFAAPANYQKHVGELGVRSVSKGRTAREQGFFLKAPGSLVGAGRSIVLPHGSERRFDHESELAVIIGRRARNVPREEAMQYVFGYSCLIDATMRIEPGVAEEERSMRKSFSTFTPLGPYIVTADEIADPQSLGNRLWVNDQLKQDANTRDMIVDIPELIELISSVLTLNPGDVIATGTPEGVGPFVSGDSVRISIESIGEMTLNVREADVRSPRPY